MSAPLSTRVCLTTAAGGPAMVSLFLVPEPRVRGGCMLHLLEQDPVREVPRSDPDLLATLAGTSLPQARARLLAAPPHRMPVWGGHGLRVLLHDHYIGDDPVGLDLADPAELARLADLPEHPVGPRRIDDFRDYAVRAAMLAVYRYFGVDQRIPLMYHGYADPASGWLAVRSASA
ncbi:hypothetical protein [Nocardia stercoris]|uniref:Uncharacterized protein n=1 Tax=Nocardia stercoris TaxID=2483361 RepID=A0A3M2LDZ7_9NOCA|nr:hypothetical protein [Nocardia stercoris]RMI34990.1 hypothetical protein EBN03_01175 [Nocardia stercoris]